MEIPLPRSSRRFYLRRAVIKNEVLFEEGGYKKGGIIAGGRFEREWLLVGDCVCRALKKFQYSHYLGGVRPGEFVIYTNFNHHKLKTQRLPSQFARQKVYVAVDHLPVHVHHYLSEC